MECNLRVPEKLGFLVPKRNSFPIPLTYLDLADIPFFSGLIVGVHVFAKASG